MVDGRDSIAMIDDIDIPEDATGATVSEFILNSKRWDNDKLKDLVHVHLVNMIRAVLIPLTYNAQDKLEWPLSGMKSFSVCYAYHLIAGNFQRDEVLGWVWRISCIKRAKTFIWLVAKNKILTNSERARRNMTMDNNCPVYNNGEETLDHLLRNCTFAKDCWRYCLGPNSFCMDRHKPLFHWIETNCTNNVWLDDSKPWSSKFVYML